MLIVLILAALVALLIFVCVNSLPICAVLTGAAMLYTLMFPPKRKRYRR